MYNIIQKSRIWLSISGVLVAVSLFALLFFGLNLGIDFTGGSLLEVKYIGERPATADIRNELAALELKSLVVQPAAEQGVILRFQETSEDIHQEILMILDALGRGEEADTAADAEAGAEFTAIEELRFDAVGPSIGQELKRRSVTAIFFVLVAIAIYIAWVFRKVSKPVASWKYGITAIIALFHDVFITIGVFSALGYFYNLEINTPFVAAILMVMGYSVNDTIVVFDRTRENLPKSEEDFEGTVNMSVNQTLMRSFNTSLTTLFVLFAILFLGGGTIRDFVLALAVGVFVGTYSSIFVASPILVLWEKMARK